MPELPAPAVDDQAIDTGVQWRNGLFMVKYARGECLDFFSDKSAFCGHLSGFSRCIANRLLWTLACSEYW
jgi:hypothetical protein